MCGREMRMELFTWLSKYIKFNLDVQEWVVMRSTQNSLKVCRAAVVVDNRSM